MEELPLMLGKDKRGNEQIIFQANQLVQAPKDDLSLLEAKFVRIVIAQIAKEDRDLQTYTCTASQLARFLKVPLSDVSREFQHIGDSLLRKLIYIKKDNGKGYRHFQWVSIIQYENGKITVKLNDALKPYVIGLDRLFTAYGPEIIMGFGSDRSMRLFELLSSYVNMGIRGYQSIRDDIPDYVQLQTNEYAFAIDDLRDFFRCQQKYSLTRDFLKFVVSEPLKTINRNTLMNVSYRTVRDGRKIKYVVFKLLTPSTRPEKIT